MISFCEAQALIAQLDLRPQVAELPLAEAAGLVLAQDVALAGDLPPFDRSAMDGFAIHGVAGRTTYPLLGTVAAGSAWPGPLQPGEAVRIMTGAPCPTGGTVVPWERASVQENKVTVADSADLLPGRNIARRGEDGRAGAVVLSAGTALSPILLALAAMAGATRLHVQTPPTIAVITTGDELGSAIADSNGPFLSALLAAWGCPAIRAHARDDAAELSAAFSRHGQAQVLVTTGGVGGSERDLVKPVAMALGFVEVFHEVAMQPGKPVLLMRHPDGRLLVGLPGNPVSVVATAHLILADMLQRLGARAVSTWTSLPAAQAHTAKGKRLLFQPAAILADGRVALIPWNGSGDLLAAAAADGLVEVAVGAVWQPGMPLRFLPYGGSTSGMRGILPRMSTP